MAAPSPAIPVTVADWQARVLWHLQQADSLLISQPLDAVTMSGRASAHARLAHAITTALDAKVIH
jgi:hypothetical protein